MTISKIATKLTFAAIALALPLLASGSAWAYASINGSACQPEYGPETASGQGLMRGTYGIQYVNNGSIIVTCPVPSISLSNTTLMASVTKNNAAGTLYIYAYATDFFGNVTSSGGGSLPSSWTGSVNLQFNLSAGASYDIFAILNKGDEINRISVSP